MKFTKKSIAEAFDIGEDDAAIAIRIIRYEFNPLDQPERFPRTSDIYGHMGTLSQDNDNEMRMCALDELCLTFGAEAIETSEYIDRFHGNIRCSYLNTGDSYATTILLDHRDNRWLFTGWGDFVESLQDKKDCNGDPIDVC